LYNHLKEKTDPFSPDNVVLVSAGLLSGTLASASARTHVMSKSPLTGYLGSTNMGGFFAPELRWAGFDHLVITGAAPKPSYLFINNGKIEIRDASSIWGETVQDTQEILRKELRDEEIQCLCIGPAGEKLVRFANVLTRHKNAGGRTGMGAVLGSKNLKAIVARGTMDIKIAFPKEALEYDKKIIRSICSTRQAPAFQRWGTMVIYGIGNTVGLIRTRNFQLNQLTDSESIECENIDEYSTGMDACFGCQLHCRHRYIIKEGPYAGTYAQGPEYTSQGTWGAEVGCRNFNTILVGNYLVNSYGMDSLEVGSLIAWAMELYEKGILTDEDTGGLKLEFGNDEAVIEMIHRIGRREGLGDILAEGGLRAAQKFGKGAEKYLIQVKGMSNLQTDERPTPSFALGVATSTRGSDHLRSRPVMDLLGLPEPLLRALYSQPVPYDGPLSSDFRDYDEGKAWQVYWSELLYMAIDMIGMCRFHSILILIDPSLPKFEEFSQMIRYNTGLDLSTKEIWECADRAYTMERLFNIREGLTRKDDWLVDRYFDEPTPLGLPIARGKVIDREKFKTLLDAYYQLHGWDESGVPKPETLKKLRLDKEPSHRL
jgi:aldehyde:ferredoxin oxidoreductase